MFKYLLSFIITILLLSQSLIAQITITAADIQAQNAVGTTHTISSDSAAKTLNIGSAGASNWDFSALKADTTYTMTSVAQGSSPYDTAFPNANIIFHYSLLFEGVKAESWVYNRLDGDYFALGIVSAGSPDSGTTVISKITENPPALQLKLPASMGTTWSQNYNQTMNILLNGTPFQQTLSRTIAQYTVDAYGTAKFPDGRTLNVLRIKNDQKTYQTPPFGGGSEIYSRTISYAFYSNTGDFLSVVAADTTEPDNGTIKVMEVGWSGYAPTAVENNKNTVLTFDLAQNYPNPFNPSTILKYSIPEDAFVQLKVYDAIGKEVAALVNQNQKRGEYSLNFNGNNLPSGIYMARITAGNYSKTVKMMLVK